MILEVAVHTINPGAETDYEAAMQQAKDTIAQSPGFISLRLSRSIENPSTYMALVEWETVDDHMVHFRQSDRFADLQKLLAPFDQSPPKVEHFEAPVVTRSKLDAAN